MCFGPRFKYSANMSIRHFITNAKVPGHFGHVEVSVQQMTLRVNEYLADGMSGKRQCLNSTTASQQAAAEPQALWVIKDGG